eukprot:1185832-Prorocentrum_minimum.AAC.2
MGKWELLCSLNGANTSGTPGSGGGLEGVWRGSGGGLEGVVQENARSCSAFVALGPMNAECLTVDSIRNNKG